MIVLGLSGKKGAGKNLVYHLIKSVADPDETGVVARVSFAGPLKQMCRVEFGWNGQKDEIGRKLLQDVGVGMRALKKDFWVDKAADAIRSLPKTTVICVITDLRFENEMKMIRGQFKGLAWRITRPGVENLDNHVSETELDGARFDRKIVNTTMDNLLSEVRSGVEELLRLYEDEDSKHSP